MRILLWHVHGGWADAFVRGAHTYLLPTTPARDGWGLGTGGRDWPSAVEIAPEELHDADVDAVLLQRPEELAEAERLLGRRLGRDVPALEGSTSGPGFALVRPEAISVVADTDGGATVLAVMFLGPLSRVTCQLADGTDVVAQLASSDALRLQPGQAVRLEVEPSPVLVVAG